MEKYRVWFFLIIANLFWAGNYVFGKYVIAELTPLWITFSRWILALVFLFPVACYIEKPVWKEAKQDWLALLCMGLLGVIGYNMVLYSALEFTTATNAALVSALNPGVIVLFSVLLYREKISLMQTAGLVISLAGALVVLTNGEMMRLLEVQFNTGDVLMLGAVIIWTLYSFVGRRLSIGPITATTLSTVIAVVLLLPFVILQGIDFANLSAVGVSGVLYMVLFPSVCSFVLWNLSVKEVGASKAGVFLNLIPVFTAAISWFLGERVTGAQAVGGLLVFAGVYLTSGILEGEKKVKKRQQKRQA